MANLEKYFDTYRELFITEGWQQFIAELEVNMESIDSLENTKSEEDLFFRKGQLNIVRYLLGFEDQIKNAEVGFLEDASSVI